MAQPQKSAKNSLFHFLPIFQCHVVQIKCSLNVPMGFWYYGYYVNEKSLENNVLQNVTYWCAQQGLLIC